MQKIKFISNLLVQKNFRNLPSVHIIVETKLGHVYTCELNRGSRTEEGGQAGTRRVLAVLVAPYFL